MQLVHATGSTDKRTAMFPGAAPLDSETILRQARTISRTLNSRKVINAANIQTVIATGNIGARGGALHGRRFFAARNENGSPVDGMSAAAYIKGFVAVRLSSAPRVFHNVTLNRLNLIRF